MAKFNVTASKRLWENSGGCGCGPEFMGIRSVIEADSWKEAIAETLYFMDLEWDYDLSEEYIEVENEGETHRYSFKRNDSFEKYIGEFTHNGVRMRGECKEFEPLVEDNGLPYVDRNIDIFDAESEDFLEYPISPFMPDCIISRNLDAFAKSIIEYRK